MSEDTLSLPYTDEEYGDMIQCYLISGKKLELTQMCYANKYPMRRQPKLQTLEIVVRMYLDSLVTNNTANPGVSFTVCSKKDKRILDYFIKNSHATITKAASIFCVTTSYIDQLLKKRKAKKVLKPKEDEETGRQKRSVKVLLKKQKKKIRGKLSTSSFLGSLIKKAATETKQDKSDSDENMVINKNESNFEENKIETVIIVEKSESNEIFCSEDISETHDADIYNEVSTSKMIDNNYLGTSIKNDTQDFGNCSETAKSETDNEFIYPEIEYTKKCNKKCSKLSGTKKPKSSKDIIIETQDVSVYSEATTSEATHHLQREITMDKSQNVGNCSETAKSETDDEYMYREIEYTKKRNKKFSKRSGTKKPKTAKDIISETQDVSVYSEATTSKATDNLQLEITMNESHNFVNCSETAKSETDDEFICPEIEYTKKRNKKFSKRSGTKKPKSSEYIISETQDDTVYSETTTSKATDNLLSEITMNESQNVENCCGTAKSETDDEFICPLIEFTKKRNKKYSKRSGTKKPKTSEYIISETQDAAVYSEATTSNATVNLLREITMNESQDVVNCSETTKSETDDEKIEYTKKRNRKYSKRSGNKKPKSSKGVISETQDVAVYSEASTSTTTDNLLCEITMNESQDVENCSETKKSKTEDDIICSEMEYTKKRKKKYLKSSSGSKKPKKIEKRKQKSSSHYPKPLELSGMLNAIVYTTRLEEMAILHKKIEHLDNATIMNDILWESKPKYNYWEHKSNINVKRTMGFKMLKTILKKLKKNIEVVDLTDNVVDDDLIITDVFYPANIITLNADDTKGISNKSDVVIVINNLFSNLCDIYVTNWKCDLIEYCCTKLNDNKYDFNRFDKTKIRLILDACCWIKRHRKVESIWPRNECNFFRFLITIHKCPPDQCNCCCKPKERNTDVTLYKPSDINVFTNKLNAKSCDKNKNLILNALRYNKPDTNKISKTCFDRQNIPGYMIYLLKDISKTGDFSFSRSECFEIGRNQDIVRFHAENYWHERRQKCYQCLNITALQRSVVDIVICCQWKLISFLIEQYKTSKISANTLKFLKGMLSRNHKVCNCCKRLLSVCDSRPKTIETSNFIVNIPEVEHTRKLVKPTLLKIGFMDKTSSRTLNTVKKIARQILQETKYAQKDSAIQTTKTVKLKVTCNQIPALDFELDNVSYQLATMIVEKFTNMKFTVKEDLKVVASLNNSIQTTSTEEFQIIAQILVQIQKCLKLVPLPPGSDIGLVAKIAIPSDLENNNTPDSFFSQFKNVNKGTVTVGEGYNNIIVKPTELAILKVLQAFTPCNSTKKKLFPKLSNADLIQNKIQKFGADDSIEIIDDSCSSQNIAHKLENEEQSSTKTSMRKNQTTYFDKVGKTKGRGENSSKNKIQVQDMVCLNFSSDHFDSDICDINYDEAYTSKLKPYDGLANVIRCSKTCYAESFKSFLKEQKKDFETEATEEQSIVLPKISSVFSLQSSSQQAQEEINEPIPSTSKVDNAEPIPSTSKVDNASNNLNTETTVSPTSNNENTNINRLNPGTPFSTGKQLMLYDPITKITQVVCLSPNGLLVPVANPLNIINPPINDNISSREPITIPENNSNVAVSTPIIVNQICDGNMTFIPALQPIQENSILPDIINDIPKNIYLRGGEINTIVVKQETKDDVVVLDSD